MSIKNNIFKNHKNNTNIIYCPSDEGRMNWQRHLLNEIPLQYNTIASHQIV